METSDLKQELSNRRAADVLRRLDALGAINLDVMVAKSSEIGAIAGLSERGEGASGSTQQQTYNGLDSRTPASAQATARRVRERYPAARIHGLVGRVEEVDESYREFAEHLRGLYRAGTPIIALCAAGIVIRSLAPLLQRKGAEPPVLALAEDGSAVVPLLGGLAGVNRLAREIGEVLAVAPAITTSGELRFGTCVLNPPAGYVLADLEQGKRFVADLLGGQPVRVEGAADWLDAARLPRDPEAALAIHVTPSARAPRAEELLIHPRCVLAALEPADAAADAVRHIKSMIGVTAEVVLCAPGGLPRSQGKAVRVRDLRPKGA